VDQLVIGLEDMFIDLLQAIVRKIQVSKSGQFRKGITINCVDGIVSQSEVEQVNSGLRIK